MMNIVHKTDIQASSLRFILVLMGEYTIAVNVNALQVLKIVLTV